MYISRKHYKVEPYSYKGGLVHYQEWLIIQFGALDEGL